MTAKKRPQAMKWLRLTVNRRRNQRKRRSPIPDMARISTIKVKPRKASNRLLLKIMKGCKLN